VRASEYDLCRFRVVATATRTVKTCPNETASRTRRAASVRKWTSAGRGGGDLFGSWVTKEINATQCVLHQGAGDVFGCTRGTHGEVSRGWRCLWVHAGNQRSTCTEEMEVTSRSSSFPARNSSRNVSRALCKGVAEENRQLRRNVWCRGAFVMRCCCCCCCCLLGLAHCFTSLVLRCSCCYLSLVLSCFVKMARLGHCLALL
jgi:hypothetical protein